MRKVHFNQKKITEAKFTLLNHKIFSHNLSKMMSFRRIKRTTTHIKKKLLSKQKSSSHGYSCYSKCSSIPVRTRSRHSYKYNLCIENQKLRFNKMYLTQPQLLIWRTATCSYVRYEALQTFLQVPFQKIAAQSVEARLTSAC